MFLRTHSKFKRIDKKTSKKVGVFRLNLCEISLITSNIQKNIKLKSTNCHGKHNLAVTFPYDLLKVIVFIELLKRLQPYDNVIIRQL